MSKIYGKGYEILSLLNIDYHQTLEEITTELMIHPNQRFELSVEKAPLKKKTKGPKYIQPESLED